jgi:uncharacterized protein YraI
MNRAHLFLLGIVCGLVVPGASLAETAYTTKSVNLRAGPSRDYELVARAPAGVPVDVYGCVDDWTWCDVSLGDDRGWVYAGNLVYPYQDRRVVILGHGPLFGFPVVTFSAGPYWDTYYRGRPWYSRRSYWVGRPAPNRWVGSRPPGVRPPASRPPGLRPPAARPPRPAVVRPPAYRPQAQPQRPRGGRPEVARPQPQPVRPAPAKPPDNRGRPPRREERKPG